MARRSILPSRCFIEIAPARYKIGTGLLDTPKSIARTGLGHTPSSTYMKNTAVGGLERRKNVHRNHSLLFFFYRKMLYFEFLTDVSLYNRNKIFSILYLGAEYRTFYQGFVRAKR